MDVLQNYMTYDTCFKIAKTIAENLDVPSSRATKVIRKFEELHPYNISQKTQIIVETFLETTRHKIGGRGKMMVVTSSRLAAVKYYHECKRYIAEKGYNIGVLVAFSGTVQDGGAEYTEPKTPAKAKGATKSEDEKPLDEIIRKINEQYKGKFTEADKVLLTTLRTKLMSNTKLQTMAKTSAPQIFADSLFPTEFHSIALNSYMESQETYTILFEDQTKYNAIMHALGSILYREMRMNL